VYLGYVVPQKYENERFIVTVSRLTFKYVLKVVTSQKKYFPDFWVMSPQTLQTVFHQICIIQNIAK